MLDFSMVVAGELTTSIDELRIETVLKPMKLLSYENLG
jgi:hypothetical protein